MLVCGISALLKYENTQFQTLVFSPKRVPFALFDHTSLSYMVFALTSAVTTLPNIALIFDDFPGPNVFLNIFEMLTNDKDATKPP